MYDIFTYIHTTYHSNHSELLYRHRPATNFKYNKTYWQVKLWRDISYSATLKWNSGHECTYWSLFDVFCFQKVIRNFQVFKHARRYSYFTIHLYVDHYGYGWMHVINLNRNQFSVHRCKMLNNKYCTWRNNISLYWLCICSHSCMWRILGNSMNNANCFG